MPVSTTTGLMPSKLVNMMRRENSSVIFKKTEGSIVRLFIKKELCKSIIRCQNQNSLFSVRITDKYLELVAEITKHQKQYTE
jgi:hypothetical protein